jgi:hypothetical protein
MSTAIAIPWKRKKTESTKKKNRTYHVLMNMLKQPSRDQLTSPEDIITYCRCRGLSKRVEKRIIGLLDGTIHTIDWRDQRTLPRSERVPRSLEFPDSPPKYWEIDYMPPVICIDENNAVTIDSA